MGWLGDHEWAAWLGAALLLAAVETLTLDLVALMLASGAAAAAVAAGLGASGPLQVGVAVGAAVGMLAVVRPVALRHLRTPTALRTGTAALVGRQAVVLERVDQHGGRVKLAGEEWSAEAYDPNQVLQVGTDVQVMEIRGATAVVWSHE